MLLNFKILRKLLKQGLVYFYDKKSFNPNKAYIFFDDIPIGVTNSRWHKIRENEDYSEWFLLTDDLKPLEIEDYLENFGIIAIFVSNVKNIKKKLGAT